MVKNILVCGSINRDFIASMSHFPADNMKCRAEKFHTTLGGSGANTASWLALNKNNLVSISSAVGTDACGDECLTAFRNQNVNYEFVNRKDISTSRAMIWIANGVKKIVTDKKNQLTSPQLYPSNDKLQKFDWVHVVQSENDSLLQFVKSCANNYVPISVDLNGRTMSEITPYATLIFANSRELEKTWGLEVDTLEFDKIKSIIGKYFKAFIVTHGAEYIKIISPLATTRIPVKPIDNIQDRTGGGDSFCAGFIDGILHGANLEHASVKGLNNARQCFELIGGQP